MAPQIEKLTQGILSLCTQLIEFDIELKVTGFIKVIADDKITFPIHFKETVQFSELTSDSRNKGHFDATASATCNVSDDNIESDQELERKAEEPEDEEGCVKCQQQTNGIVTFPITDNKSTRSNQLSEKTNGISRKHRKKRRLMKSVTVLYDEEKDKVLNNIVPLPEHISDITPVFPCFMCRLPSSNTDKALKKPDQHPDSAGGSIPTVELEHSRTMEHSNLSEKVSLTSNKSIHIFRTFETEEELLSHGRLDHKDVKTFECSKCSEIFSSFVKFHQHLYTKHEDIRNYLCKICNKRFIWAAHVVKHAEIHGTHKYICHDCPQQETFFTMMEYRNHLKAEHTEVTCEYCKFVSTSQKAHTEHMKSMHPDEGRPRDSIIMQLVSQQEVPKPQAIAAAATEDIQNKVFVTERMTKEGRPFKVRQRLKYLRDLTFIIIDRKAGR